MSNINIADNIVRLRHEKKLTQEQLADFVGVTKASVSKWETAQSMPDILILPKLASYFGVSIDELLGYESSLSKEQIEKIYQDFTMAFTKEPFDAVIERIETLIKQYYSCYPFLYYMALLYLNHFMLVPEKEKQIAVLTKAYELCAHIMDNCKERYTCNDTQILKCVIALQLGKAQEVVDSLEDSMNPLRIAGQGEELLIQAYQMVGEVEKAREFTQISMRNHLFLLLINATWDIAMNGEDRKRCEETIRRIERMIQAFHMDEMLQDKTCLFRLQAAIMYAGHNQSDSVMRMLEEYVKGFTNLFSADKEMAQKDTYFDKADQVYEQASGYVKLPRDLKVIWESAISIFQHPAFAKYQEDTKFCELRQQLLENAQKV